MSWLIDRAFCITPNMKSNKIIIKNNTNKNKSLLIKILYDTNSNNLLQCFNKNVKKWQKSIVFMYTEIKNIT